MTYRTKMTGLTLGVASMLAVAAGGAVAQDYPTRAITLIVPFAAGGGATQVAQLLSIELEQVLGQTIIVDNQPGAGTTLGTANAARAEPDGYTLLLASSVMGANVALIDDLPYDTLADFTPISLTVDAPYVLLVNPEAGIETVEELIEFAAENPGSAIYGSAGIGSSHQLFMEFLAATTGVEMRHIPYQGGNPAATAVASGEILVTFADAGAVVEMVNGGLVRALAVSSGDRLAIMPDVPTMEEAGVEGYNLTTWQAIAGPAGMSDEVVAILNEAIVEVLSQPEIQQSLEATGKFARPSTPEEFAEFLREDVERWQQVVAEAGIEVE